MKQQLPLRMPQRVYVMSDKDTGATTTIAVDKPLKLKAARQIIRDGFVVSAAGFQSKSKTRSRIICKLNDRTARFTKQAPCRASMFL